MRQPPPLLRGPGGSLRPTGGRSFERTAPGLEHPGWEVEPDQIPKEVSNGLLPTPRDLVPTAVHLDRTEGSLSPPSQFMQGQPRCPRRPTAGAKTSFPPQPSSSGHLEGSVPAPPTRLRSSEPACGRLADPDCSRLSGRSQPGSLLRRSGLLQGKGRDRGHRQRGIVQPKTPPALLQQGKSHHRRERRPQPREPASHRHARAAALLMLHYLLAFGTEAGGSQGGVRPVVWGGGGAGEGSHLGPLSSRLCMWMCQADLLRGLRTGGKGHQEAGGWGVVGQGRAGQGPLQGQAKSEQRGHCCRGMSSLHRWQDDQHP